MAADPGLALRDGLLREMSPFQALVMMQLYYQLPQRWDRSGRHGMFFSPDEAGIMRMLKLKPPRYYWFIGRLVRGGYLEKRRADSGMEYRICFEHLKHYLEPKSPTPTGPM